MLPGTVGGEPGTSERLSVRRVAVLSPAPGGDPVATHKRGGRRKRPADSTLARASPDLLSARTAVRILPLEATAVAGFPPPSTDYPIVYNVVMLGSSGDPPTMRTRQTAANECGISTCRGHCPRPRLARAESARSSDTPFPAPWGAAVRPHPGLIVLGLDHTTAASILTSSARGSPPARALPPAWRWMGLLSGLLTC